MFAQSLALVGLVVVSLAAVPLVAYLSRYVALDGDADRHDPGDGYVTYGTRDARPDGVVGEGDEGPRSCPRCGLAVPDGYDYCGGCAARVVDGGERR